MQRVNNVPKEKLLVTTDHGLQYELGPADDNNGERTITIGGIPLTGSKRWGVKFLLVGQPMTYFPEGSCDASDVRATPFPVKSIEEQE